MKKKLCLLICFLFSPTLFCFPYLIKNEKSGKWGIQDSEWPTCSSDVATKRGGVDGIANIITSYGYIDADGNGHLPYNKGVEKIDGYKWAKDLTELYQGCPGSWFGTNDELVFPSNITRWFDGASGADWVQISYFYEGLAAVKLNGKWGYVNTKGTTVIGFQFDGADDFYEGLAFVKLGDYWGVINGAGALVISYQFNAPSSFLCGIAEVEVKTTAGQSYTTFINKYGTRLTRLYSSVPYFYISRCGSGGNVIACTPTTSEENATEQYDYLHIDSNGNFSTVMMGVNADDNPINELIKQLRY